MRAVTFALVAVLSASAGLSAQSGSFTTFGSGCGGARQGTRLAAPAVPRIGANFTVQLSVPPQACCLPLLQWTSTMALGLTNRNWRGVPLPLPLLGCNLLVGPDVLVSKVHAGSCCPPRDSLTAPIPSSAALVGVHFYVQWMQQTASQRAPWFSEGGHGVIGR